MLNKEDNEKTEQLQKVIVDFLIKHKCKQHIADNAIKYLRNYLLTRTGEQEVKLRQ